MSSQNNMKVIVVGGGPVGLTTAHFLAKAGIEYVLLEQRPSPVIDAGSNLVLQTEGLVTLQSLNILKQINAVSTPLADITRVNHSGKPIGNVEFFKYQKKNTGFAPRCISRHDLTKVLYDTLPSTDNIFVNKKLATISETTDGVTVTCLDGSTYTGTMVIGADGAHSKTRSQMRDLAVSQSKPTNKETPFLVSNNCLWIRSPIINGIKPGMSSETHGDGCATQFFVGEDTAVLGLYERRSEPTSERIRYTEGDEQAIAQRWGHLKITADLTVGQMYTQRLNAGLVSLEEGVLDHWSLGSKIVLVGDAAHKYTPSTGSGCNNGMVDARTLVSELSALAIADAAGLEAAFTAYQTQRYQASVANCERSGQATAMATWSNSIMKFIDVHVMPRWVVQTFIGRSIKA